MEKLTYKPDIYKVLGLILRTGKKIIELKIMVLPGLRKLMFDRYKVSICECKILWR
jgi:hypothetical protein